MIRSLPEKRPPLLEKRSAYYVQLGRFLRESEGEFYFYFISLSNNLEK